MAVAEYGYQTVHSVSTGPEQHSANRGWKQAFEVHDERMQCAFRRVSVTTAGCTVAHPDMQCVAGQEPTETVLIRLFPCLV